MFIVVTLLLIGGVYWYFSSGTGNQQPLTAVPEVTGQNSARRHFQILVSELHSISFDSSIFSSSEFRSLISLATPVAPESLGRLDPFAPISSSVNTISGTAVQ